MKKVNVEKKIVLCLVLASILLVSYVITTSSGQNGTVMSIGNHTISPGETIEVPINISNAADLATAEIYLNYDPSTVHVTAVSDGDFDLTLNEIHNDSGWTRIGGAQLISDPLTGDITLAHVTLEAHGLPGSMSPLTLSNLLFQDITGAPLTITPHNGTVTISGNTPSASIQDCLVQTSEIITIPLMIHNVTDMASVEINMSYDPSVVHILSVSDGNFDLTLSDIHNDSGWTRIGGTQLISDWITGDAILAQITCKAYGHACSSSLLEITNILTQNKNGLSISLDTDNGVFEIGSTLTLTTIGEGTVIAEPAMDIYPCGTSVTLTATGQYPFDYWTGDLTGDENPATITMDDDKTITAYFTRETSYTLTVNTIGQGTVIWDPIQETYTHGTQIILTAIPNTGWTFSHWTGDFTGSTNPSTITMTTDKTITAHFISTSYCDWHLTITTKGNGFVTANPLQDTYSCNQQVTLTATPANGWTFSHWSGGITGINNPITIYYSNTLTVTMNNHKSFTANFKREGIISGVSANPNPQNPGEPITISCYIPSNIEVNEVNVVIFYPRCILKEKISLKPDAIGNTYYCMRTFNVSGGYSYFIQAEDTEGYTIFSDWHTFKIMP